MVGGTSTIHIPGLGNVQVATGAAIQQLATTPQVLSSVSAQPLATQQALQQDPSDPNKWHVVQVATAQPLTVATAPTGMVASATGATVATEAAGSSSAVVGSSSGGTTSGQQPTKTRLRRVACTCPNCKDGDRSRSK